jgi:exonuclease SbcD
MTLSPVTILLFADTHLGFDLPLHGRIQVRRRGEDFFANYRRILETAVEQKVDLLVHGGDLFFRSRVPAAIVERAYEPLVQVARAGIPVYLVPGNHERSRLPTHLWLSHEHIHVFDQPRTFLQPVGNSRVALAGFPFARKVHPNFQDLLAQTGYGEIEADLRFLCLHQAFEGATVGPADFTFRQDADTLSIAQIPAGFTAVLSGHIHRSQQLAHSTGHSQYHTPVIYPGSIERTSFAERFEAKHFVLLRVHPGEARPQVEFQRLPARPMHRLSLATAGLTQEALRRQIQASLAEIEPDAIVRLQLNGPGGQMESAGLSAAELRSLAPASMNLSLAYTWKKARPQNNPARASTPVVPRPDL